MGFYSFDVWADGEVQLPEVFIVLERGQNGFNCIVNDLDEFVGRLTSKGVRLLKPPFRLDEHEQLTSSDITALADGTLPPESAPHQPPILVPGVSEDSGDDPPVCASGAGRGGFPTVGDEPDGRGDPSH